MRIELPPYIEYALNKLIESGYDAYVVGGCVRDGLLGLKPNDWDIATCATPPEIVAVFADYKALLHGEKYGTVAVLFGGVTVEITTYRTDGEYTDNRRPDSVRFTRNLRDDMSRRDFTINALAYRHDCGVVDCFGGRADITGGIIRCVGEPDARFGEDALRILRAIRFASVLSFKIEEHTAATVHDLKFNLLNISGERICAELTDLLSGAGDGVAAVLMEFWDVFTVIIPELSVSAADADSTARAIRFSPTDLSLRLALLLRGTAGGATGAGSADGARSTDGAGSANGAGYANGPEDSAPYKILRRLRFSNKTIEDTTLIISYMESDITGGAPAVKRLLNRLGENRLRLLLRARRAVEFAEADGDFTTSRPPKEIDAAERLMSGIISRGECYSLKQLNIDGGDLLIIGYRPGKRLGAALNALLEQVVAGRCPNEREALLRLAKSMHENL